MTKFLAQSLAQNQATLKAIQSMKQASKSESETSFNWLLTYACVDMISLFRTLISELTPGVCVRGCVYAFTMFPTTGGGAKRVTRGIRWAEGRSRKRHPLVRSAPQVQIFHLHLGCGHGTMPHSPQVCGGVQMAKAHIPTPRTQFCLEDAVEYHECQLTRILVW